VQFDLLDAMYASKTLHGWFLVDWLEAHDFELIPPLLDRVWQLIRDGILKPQTGNRSPPMFEPRGCECELGHAQRMHLRVLGHL
jgi:hypothetical protein